MQRTVRDKVKHSKESLQAIADTVQSKAELLEKLGRRKNGGSYTFLCRKIRQLGIDISHFRNPKDRSGPLRGGSFSKIPMNEVFVLDRLKGYREGSALLRRCMLEYGFEYTCGVCKKPPVWENKPLTLQIDHINGEATDNRVCNLRFICPNCHTQTDTYAGRKTAKPYYCGSCGRLKKKGSKRCRRCAQLERGVRAPQKTKIVWPEVHELALMVWQEPGQKLARRLGLSQSALKKRCNKLGIPTPTRGFWSKPLAQETASAFVAQWIEQRFPKPQVARSSRAGGTNVTYPSPADLTILLQARPATEVAKDLGVTSVALKKHCKKVGVATPPRGYWAKVKAGKA